MNSNSKLIIIVGDWLYPQYEAAFSASLKDLGYEVEPIVSTKYTKGIFRKILTLIPIPTKSMVQLNKEVKSNVYTKRPCAVIFWKCTHIFPSTIKYIEQIKIKTISYNNDDPFRHRFGIYSKWYDFFHWYWYNKTLKYFSYNFFYRLKNVEEAEKYYGASHANILMPYYQPMRNKPIKLNESDKKKYNCDIAFIGHYEADLRVDCLEALVNAGYKVKLFGSNRTWTRKVLGNDLYDYFYPIQFVNGDDYNKALNGAKVCLAFLSKLNRDTYTRRSFEIPASGRLMLSERTDDLLNLFKEDEEACFFSNKKELIRKVKFLLDNPKIREKIARKGRERVMNDKHDVKSRVAQFIKNIN